MKRKYYGFVKLTKVYRGAKSVNLVISKDEGLSLAQSILNAISGSPSFDLAIYDHKKGKDGRIRMTVTSIR
ncbi:hypothetical protein HYU40_05065 [Candidatus Woesearchaeota archaeon]|nr:hypothetical protein [Candidatus Woesearchaeota archaeon]